MEKNNKPKNRFFNRLLRDQFFCGLDLGGKTVKASLVRAEDPENLDLLGVVEEPTSGLKDSSVSDLGELTACVRRVMDRLSKKTNHQVKQVYLGLGGNFLTYRASQAVIPLVDQGNKVISHLDIRKVNHQARLLGTQLDEEVVHEFATRYRVDDVNVALNPSGLFGRKLNVEQLLIIGNSMQLRNIVKAINHAGFEVARTAFNSYAAADVCLPEQERKEGSVIVDAGASSTSVLIFVDDVLKSVHTLKRGGHFITQTIAQRIHVSFDLAEDIKKSYAGPVDNDQKDNEEILVKRDEGYVPVKRSEVASAVNEATGIILDDIHQAIVLSGLHSSINVGMTVVGGGAMIPGLMEKLEKMLRFPVKMGLLTQGLQNSAIYAGCVGLAQGACTHSVRYSIASKTPQTWLQAMSERMRMLYHEYF